MTTTPTPAEPQAGDTGGTPPAPAATTTTPDPQAGDGQEPLSLEEARKLRRENQTLRQRQKAIDDEKAAAEAAKLSEIEKVTKAQAELQARNEALMAQVLEQNVFQAVAQLAGKLNFDTDIIPSNMLYRLLEWDENEPDHIEFDEESGQPSNIEKLLKKIAEAAPKLLKQQAAAPGTPTLPAMNPGRSSIQPPASGTPGRIPRLDDPGLWKR